MVLVSGGNRQGKSSVIDAIHSALAGKSYYKKHIKNVIKDGEEEAHVTISTDKFEIHRYWKRNGKDYIKIKDKDDVPQGAEETLLSRFYNEYSRDPHRMSQMDSKEQVEFIFEMLGLADRLNELDSEYKEVYDQRRDINRDLKKEQAKLEGLQEFDEIPEVPEFTDLQKELEEIQKFNQEIESHKYRLESIKEQHKEKQNTIDAVDVEIKHLEEKLKVQKELREKLINEKTELNERIQKGEKWIKENDPKDPSDVIQKISEIQDLQEEKRKAEQYMQLKDEVKTLERKANDKTIELEEIEKMKVSLVTDRKMPVKGMEFTEESITFNGIDIQDMSKSEKIIFWSKVFMSTDPELKFLTLDDGESLDSKSKEELAKFAKENDLLYIVTVVDDSKETGIVLMEGEIVKNNYKSENK